MSTRISHWSRRLVAASLVISWLPTDLRVALAQDQDAGKGANAAAPPIVPLKGAKKDNEKKPKAGAKKGAAAPAAAHHGRLLPTVDMGRANEVIGVWPLLAPLEDHAGALAACIPVGCAAELTSARSAVDSARSAIRLVLKQSPDRSVTIDKLLGDASAQLASQEVPMKSGGREREIANGAAAALRSLVLAVKAEMVRAPRSPAVVVPTVERRDAGTSRRDCRALGTLSDSEYGAILANEEKKPFLSRRFLAARPPDITTVTYDAASRSYDRERASTLHRSLVRVCVANADYRFRYWLDGSGVRELASSPIDSVLPSRAPAGDAGTTDGPTALALTLGRSLKRLNLLVPSTAVIAAAPAAAAAPEPPTNVALLEGQLAFEQQRAQELGAEVADAQQAATTLAHALSSAKRGSAPSIGRVKGLARELTGSIAVLEPRARQIGLLLEEAVHDLGAARRLPGEVAALAEGVERLQGAADASVAAIDDAEKQAKDGVERAIGSEKTAYQALLAPYGNLAARTRDLQGRIGSLAAELANMKTAAGELGTAASHDAIVAWALARDMLNHIAAVDHNVLYLPTEPDKSYDIVLKSEQLTLDSNAQRALTALAEPVLEGTGGAFTRPSTFSGGGQALVANAYSGYLLRDAGGNFWPIKGNDTKDFTLSTSIAPADAGPADGDYAVVPSRAGATTANGLIGMTYTPVPALDARTTLEVRSRTWLRVNLGLVLSALRDPGYVLGHNDVGAQVITHGDDPGIVPVVFLSHYWCGVDLKETRLYAYDRFHSCGWANTFLPTFAVGIPLNRSPLQNTFIGGLLTPIPGLGLVAGAHIGQITELRHGFVDGQPPPLVSGQAFDVRDATEQHVRVGGYVGAVLTDALFISLLSSLPGFK